MKTHGISAIPKLRLETIMKTIKLSPIPKFIIGKHYENNIHLINSEIRIRKQYENT